MTVKVNEQVLRDAVEAIELDLEHWDQVHFFNGAAPCGTTACLAGFIAAQAMQGNLKDAMHHIAYLNIPTIALDALGITRMQDRSTFHRDVFCYTHNAEAIVGGQLAQTPAALKIFKERITQVTGVEF